jgi:hypothetical protein
MLSPVQACPRPHGHCIPCVRSFHPAPCWITCFPSDLTYFSLLQWLTSWVHTFQQSALLTSLFFHGRLKVIWWGTGWLRLSICWSVMVEMRAICPCFGKYWNLHSFTTVFMSLNILTTLHESFRIWRDFLPFFPTMFPKLLFLLILYITVVVGWIMVHQGECGRNIMEGWI